MDTPIIKLFEYNNHYYVYDAFQNHILELDKKHYIELCKLSRVGLSKYSNEAYEAPAKDILSLVQKGYFKSAIVDQISHPESEFLLDLLNNNVGYMQFQVTQECNLECRYCAFAAKNSYVRSHNNATMQLIVAEKALDFLVEHSMCVPEIRISFYGGEPLLQFALIKKITELANEKFKTKNVRYFITTNLTVFSNEILQYLVENSVHLLVSFDGNKNSQDSHRRYKINGQGTYDTVIGNVDIIRSQNNEYFSKFVRFNAVVFPDESKTDTFDFFRGLGVCNEKVSVVDADLRGIDYFVNFLNKPQNENVVSLSERENSLSVENILAERRTLSPIWHPNGVCIPGIGRLLVDVFGNFYPCEKVIENNITKIGDVITGFDFEKIKCLTNIGKLTEEHCKKCWALRFCSSCVLHCTDAEQNTLSVDLKNKHCESEKKRIEIAIKRLISEQRNYENTIDCTRIYDKSNPN